MPCKVQPVEALQLKGKRDKVAAYRLIAVDPDAAAITRHLDAPLVGRVRELKRLLGDFEDAISEQSCHLFTMLGPAGVGKSRLVAEFLNQVGDEADVCRSRCLHYGDDITYWPLVEILVELGVEPTDVIGGSPADTQLAFRKLLETRARDQAAGCGVRRHPVGRTGLPRPHRARGGLVPRCADPVVVRGEARTPRRP